MVQQDVETQDLETQRVLQVVWLRRPIRVLQTRLHCEQSLHYHVLDLRPQLLHIHAFLMHTYMFQYCC